MSTKWRPPQTVRPIAIAVIRRANSLLLMNVRDDAGVTKGWRPIGGAIEFGEHAAATIAREIREELVVGTTDVRFVGVLENIYEHEGAKGHELVMVYDVTLENRGYNEDDYRFIDGGVVVETEWVDVERFERGESELFPNGLLELVSSKTAR